MIHPFPNSRDENYSLVGGTVVCCLIFWSDSPFGNPRFVHPYFVIATKRQWNSARNAANRSWNTSPVLGTRHSFSEYVTHFWNTSLVLEHGTRFLEHVTRSWNMSPVLGTCHLFLVDNEPSGRSFIWQITHSCKKVIGKYVHRQSHWSLIFCLLSDHGFYYGFQLSVLKMVQIMFKRLLIILLRWLVMW